MGGVQKRQQRLESVARQVAGDLVDISSALDTIVDSFRLPSGRKTHLLDVADRVQRTYELLAVELDRAEPNHVFLRKAVAAGVSAASLAASFCSGVLASEVSERIDLRSPIEIVSHSAADAEQAEMELQITPEAANEAFATGWRTVGEPENILYHLEGASGPIGFRLSDNGELVSLDLSCKWDGKDWSADIHHPSSPYSDEEAVARMALRWISSGSELSGSELAELQSRLVRLPESGG